MEIGFKSRQLNVLLIFGLIWLIWVVVIILIKKELDWTAYGYLAISAGYLILYFYHKHYKYVTIQNGIIRLNGPLGKKMRVSEIKQIKKFAGDYILKSNNKELSINTQYIDQNMLDRLTAELDKLKVERN
ncbi:MAG: hypothetical protein JJU28_24095 [Cyclobacteriaceae bacterium]|nr:hypothetical protein [Cyclobacteriaceae bacterium]